MDILRTSRTMKAFTANLLAGVAIALMMAPATSRLAAPPVAQQHAAGATHKELDHCISRPWQEAGRCGQCDHFLTHHITEDEDAWLLAVYANRGRVIPNRQLRGRSRRSTPKQLPHQFFISAMEEALEAIADLEPGATVHIAIFSEGHSGSMVDEHGKRASWSASHGLCDRMGLDCSKTEVVLHKSRSMEDAVKCMSSSDVFIAGDDEFSRRAAMMSQNVRMVTPHGDHLEDEYAVVLGVDSALRGLTASERSELRGVIRQWRGCSSEMRHLMLATA